MKRFRKVYLEITNCCNLRCSFCPGTRRTPGFMSLEVFTELSEKLRPWTDYLYFHLMGEPLAHPMLAQFLEIAHRLGFRVILTTNGTLLHRHQALLLAASALHKVNISLQSFEANALSASVETYLAQCLAFGKAAQGQFPVIYRLWNQGGADARNQELLAGLKTAFPDPWVQEPRALRIGQRIYLEYGQQFQWPDLEAPEGSRQVFCYGLQDQLGVLWDGTVVPCCLDHEGDLALGNLLDQPLGDILDSPRAQAIYQGFQAGIAAEALCRRCGYARRFRK